MGNDTETAAPTEADQQLKQFLIQARRSFSAMPYAAGMAPRPFRTLDDVTASLGELVKVLTHVAERDNARETKLAAYESQLRAVGSLIRAATELSEPRETEAQRRLREQRG